MQAYLVWRRTSQWRAATGRFFKDSTLPLPGRPWSLPSFVIKSPSQTGWLWWWSLVVGLKWKAPSLLGKSILSDEKRLIFFKKSDSIAWWCSHSETLLPSWSWHLTGVLIDHFLDHWHSWDYLDLTFFPAHSGTRWSFSYAPLALQSWGPRSVTDWYLAQSTGAFLLPWCRNYSIFSRFMQTIFVDRQSSKSRRAAVTEIRRRATEPGWPRWMNFGDCESQFVMVAMIQGADLSRGHHNWRHSPHPLSVICSHPFSSPYSIIFQSYNHVIATPFVNPHSTGLEPSSQGGLSSRYCRPFLLKSLLILSFPLSSSLCLTDLLQSFLVLSCLTFSFRWGSVMREPMPWFGPRAHPPCSGLVFLRSFGWWWRGGRWWRR